MSISGKVSIILGPMFSGKTTELNRRLTRYELAQKKVFRIRYKNDTVQTTHDGVKKKGEKTFKLYELKNQIEKFDIIGIDEAQFFDDLIDFVKYCADLGKIVIVAGCDGTFEMKPFGKICDLISVADEIVKLNAVCKICGYDAPFSLRITKEIQEVELIGSEHYMACCRSCYNIKTKGIKIYSTINQI